MNSLSRTIILASVLFAMAVSVVVPLSDALAQTYSAQANPSTLLNSIGNAVFGSAATNKSLEQIVGELIKAFLGVIGTVFFFLTLYAGYLYLTAQGETEKVEKAQQILITATIGIIIIALSYAITVFITGLVAGSTQ